MTDAQKIKIFDGKHKNQQVRLQYHLDKKSVRIVCRRPETGSEYLRKLITDGHIGLVDAVIYSVRLDSKVIALMRGIGLDKFLRAGIQSTETPDRTRKSFRQIVDSEESETGS
jgi:hypothetical protein